MLGYFKREGEPSKGALPKRPRAAPGMAAFSKGRDTSTLSPADGRDPLTFITWNANGLGVRLSKDWHEFKEFLTSVRPDVCCLQEVRFAAAGVANCKRDDNLGRKRGQLKADSKTDKQDRQLLRDTLEAFASKTGYRLVLSLANTKYAGTGALIRSTCPTSDIFYNVTPEGLSKEHDLQGRVIALEFASFTLVILYVPNNGTKEESFRRREDWDANLRAFVNCYDKPLIICGDLNVAHENSDLTHPAFFKRMCPASQPRNSGQPGCTPAERERHSQLLACAGGLVDAYRLLHPTSSLPPPPHVSSDKGSGGQRGSGSGDGGGAVNSDAPGITWRGTAGRDIAEMGKFYGKGMRIDYFLVTKGLADQVSEVKVFGRGKDRQGFMGSDHCPVLLRLKESVEVAPHGQLAASASSSSSSSSSGGRGGGSSCCSTGTGGGGTEEEGVGSGDGGVGSTEEGKATSEAELLGGGLRRLPSKIRP